MTHHLGNSLFQTSGQAAACGGAGGGRGGPGLGHPQSSGIQVPRALGPSVAEGAPATHPEPRPPQGRRQRVWGAYATLRPL